MAIDCEGQMSDQEHFWEETRRLLVLVLAVVTMAWVGLGVATYAFPVAYIDLRSVHVADGMENPTVTADRSIKGDVSLSYLVTVRDERSQFICSSGWQGPLNYKKAASETNPLVMSLSKWMGTTSLEHIGCTDGFDAGRFTIETCHQAKILGMLPVERCVKSNVFER